MSSSDGLEGKTESLLKEGLLAMKASWQYILDNYFHKFYCNVEQRNMSNLWEGCKSTGTLVRDGNPRACWHADGSAKRH